MSRETSSEKKVVVFDFDGKLVRRDSFLDFSVRYCLARPWRLLALVLVSPVAAVCAFRSFRAVASTLLWAMTVGASTRGFTRALRRYAVEILPNHANGSILEELARHLRDGDRVVIATGSIPLIVRGLLGARELGRLPIVGSRLRRRFGGLVVDTHCVGRTKVRELERRLGIVTWATVYTDSFTDRSLLRHARNITLVAPGRKTLLRTRTLVGEAATVRVLWPR